MRIRRVSPLFLILAPSLVASDAVPGQSDSREVLSNEDILALNGAVKAGNAANEPIGPQLPSTTSLNARAVNTQKPYKGTEDAPVDGQDGKPHAGPFVDRKPDDARTRNGLEDTATTTSKSLPTSLENLRPHELADIPEKNDGVMNDESRPLPKKGTTGTEGGISEKEKARKEKDTLVENKPQEPKEAPPLPHSEEERIEKSEEKKGAKVKDSASSKSGQDPITGEKLDLKKEKDGSYGEAGYGMEKPKDLPEKPHDIPTPKPNIATDNLGPPVNPDGGKDKWLMDTMPETEGKMNRRPAKSSKTSTIGAEAEHEHHETWHEWFHSFVLSFTMIIFSEIGDKTFLVAALMAMRHSRTLVFSAALAALMAMTVLSAVLGHAFPTLLPKRFTTFAAALLFFVFGAKSLREGLAMSPDAGVGDEMREVEAELEEKEHKLRRKSKSDLLSPYELESGRGRSHTFDKMGRPEPSPPLSRSPTPPRRSGDRFSGIVNLCSLVLSPAWVQTFIMTFLGEWGDRSQIATIAMAAGQDYWWVTLGAIVGHACCTGMAVVGGRALAGKVSMRVVTIGGAVAFLVFGCIYLYECITE